MASLYNQLKYALDGHKVSTFFAYEFIGSMVLAFAFNWLRNSF